MSIQRYFTSSLLVATTSLMFGCKSISNERTSEKDKLRAEIETLKDGGLYERIMYFYISGIDDEQPCKRKAERIMEVQVYLGQGVCPETY